MDAGGQSLFYSGQWLTEMLDDQKRLPSRQKIFNPTATILSLRRCLLIAS